MPVTRMANGLDFQRLGIIPVVIAGGLFAAIKTWQRRRRRQLAATNRIVYAFARSTLTRRAVIHAFWAKEFIAPSAQLAAALSATVHVDNIRNSC